MKRPSLFPISIPFVLVVVVFWCLGFAVPALSVELESPLSTEDIPTLLGNIIKTVLGIVGSIALLMFIYGGLMWLTSGGNPEKIKKGRDILVWATLGLAIIFLSYTLVGFVIRALTGPTEEERAMEAVDCVDRCLREGKEPQECEALCL